MLDMTTEEFKTAARAVHGEKYGYWKVTYKGPVRYITVECSIHGPFKQRPRGHLKGGGCLKCIKGTDANAIYIWQVDTLDIFKIGITSQRLGVDRINKVAAQLSADFQYEVVPNVCILYVSVYAREIEKILHNLYPDKIQYISSNVNGSTEFKQLTSTELEYAITLIKNYKDK